MGRLPPCRLSPGDPHRPYDREPLGGGQGPAQRESIGWRKTGPLAAPQRAARTADWLAARPAPKPQLVRRPQRPLRRGPPFRNPALSSEHIPLRCWSHGLHVTGATNRDSGSWPFARPVGRGNANANKASLHPHSGANGPPTSHACPSAAPAASGHSDPDSANPYPSTHQYDHAN